MLKYTEQQEGDKTKGKKSDSTAALLAWEILKLQAFL